MGIGVGGQEETELTEILDSGDQHRGQTFIVHYKNLYITFQPIRVRLHNQGSNHGTVPLNLICLPVTLWGKGSITQGFPCVSMETEEAAMALGTGPVFCLTGLPGANHSRISDLDSLSGRRRPGQHSLSIPLLPPLGSLPHPPHETAQQIQQSLSCFLITSEALK